MGTCRKLNVNTKNFKYNKLDKFTEVTFTAYENIDACNYANAKNYVSSNGTVKYDRFNRPEDKLNCMSAGCINTGTLAISKDGNAVYEFDVKGEDFINGVITFYAKGKGKVELSNKSTFDKVNTYEFDATETNLIVRQIVSDFVGDAEWEINGKVYLRFSATEDIEISSISLFESIEDLKKKDAIVMRCLSSITNDISLNVANASCTSGGYDTSSPLALQISISGRLVTGNRDRLNPILVQNDNVVEGTDYTTISEKVVAKTIDGKEFGHISLNGYTENNCLATFVQFAEACDTTDSILREVSGNVLVDVAEDEFVIINDGDDKILVVSKNIVGQELIVKYPKGVKIERKDITEKDLTNKKFALQYKTCDSDGTEHINTYHSVYITSIPMGVNTTEDEDITLTLSIQADNKGSYGTVDKLVK